MKKFIRDKIEPYVDDFVTALTGVYSEINNQKKELDKKLNDYDRMKKNLEAQTKEGEAKIFEVQGRLNNDIIKQKELNQQVEIQISQAQRSQNEADKIKQEIENEKQQIENMRDAIDKELTKHRDKNKLYDLKIYDLGKDKERLDTLKSELKLKKDKLDAFDRALQARQERIIESSSEIARREAMVDADYRRLEQEKERIQAGV